MEQINFSFKKNNKYIIDEKKINCIAKNDNLSFMIEGKKYQIHNNILTKDTGNELIKLDFNTNKASIFLKDIKKELYLNLIEVDIKREKKQTKIEYKIETEKDSINIITIEYTKSS